MAAFEWISISLFKVISRLSYDLSTNLVQNLEALELL